MRTTEAARYARWSVTFAAVLAIAVAGAYFVRARQARRSDAALPPSVSPGVQQQSAEFSFSKVEGEHTQFVVRASRATEFKEGGRNLLEDVWITAYGNNGQRSDEMHTHSCEYLPAASKISCPGEVSIDLKNNAPANTQANADPLSAAHIVTSNLTFDRQTGMASTPEAVQFRFAQGEGKATGLSYDSRTGEMHLLREVQISLHSAESVEVDSPQHSASAPGQGMNLSGDELNYLKNEHLMALKGQAQLQQGSQRLHAGQINFELDDDMHARRLVATMNPQIEDSNNGENMSIASAEIAIPLDESAKPLSLIAKGNVVINATRSGGTDKLTSNSAELEFFPESQQPRHFSANENVVVESHVADQSMRRLQTSKLDVSFLPSQQGDYRIEKLTAAPGNVDWQSPPGKSAESMRLIARQLDGSFSDTGNLRELRGSGGVEMHKRTANQPETVSTSRDLVAKLGADGSWETVDQSGDVKLKSENGTAQSDRAHFDRAADSATLTGSVVLTDQSSQTHAHSAIFRQSTNELRAEGGVSTTQTSAANNSTGAAAEAVHVTSNGLTANTMTGHAQYSGNARLWQSSSVIQGDSIDLDRETNRLVATGRVRALFPSSGQSPGPRKSVSSGTAKPTMWRAEAARLTYDQASHNALLEKDAHAVSQDGSISADRIEIVFSPAEGEKGQKALASQLPDVNSSGVQEVKAAGNVKIENAGRSGTAEKGDYKTAEGKFILSGGSPKVMDGFGNSAAGRELTFFLADDRIVIASEQGSRTLTLHRVGK